MGENALLGGKKKSCKCGVGKPAGWKLPEEETTVSVKEKRLLIRGRGFSGGIASNVRRPGPRHTNELC